MLTIALLAGLAADDTNQSVLRATLDNGLRVVIVRDPLAPVVTVEENYLAGGKIRLRASPEWRTRRNIWPSADARA